MRCNVVVTGGLSSNRDGDTNSFANLKTLAGCVCSRDIQVRVKIFDLMWGVVSLRITGFHKSRLFIIEILCL